MPDLTAADLYEIVRGWPDEATPSMLDILPSPDPNPWDWTLDCEYLADPKVVEMLHEASGLRWLVRRQAACLSSSPMVTFCSGPGYEEWAVDLGGGRAAGRATFLHAIDAAIRGVG